MTRFQLLGIEEREIFGQQREFPEIHETIQLPLPLSHIVPCIHSSRDTCQSELKSPGEFSHSQTIGH